MARPGRPPAVTVALAHQWRREPTNALSAESDRLPGDDLPDPAIPMVASALNLSRAEVYGVFTFYPDFRKRPAGLHVLKLCRAEACQAAGGDALAARAEARLGIVLGDTTADQRVTLEPIYCLGLCATAPSASATSSRAGTRLT